MARMTDGSAHRVPMWFISLPLPWRMWMILGKRIIADLVRSQLPDPLHSQTPNVLLAGSCSTP